MKICPAHGPDSTSEEILKHLDDETVRHYDGRCGQNPRLVPEAYLGAPQPCAVCYDHSQFPKNYTRADVETYLLYCAQEEAHYLQDPGCICTPSDLQILLETAR